MFKKVKRLINWTGDRKKRIYLGFVYSFFNTICMAFSIMGAAYGLNLILEDMQGKIIITTAHVFYMILFMSGAVAGRFIFAYLRAVTQESVCYETTTEERINIGNILKRVPLGFLTENNTGTITSAVTTDLSFMEMLGMKMIDIVVNGYISAFAMVICIAFYNVWIAVIALAGIVLSAVFLTLLRQLSEKNAPIHQAAQDKMIAATLEYLRGMQVVKSYNQRGLTRARITEAYKMSKDVNIKMEKYYAPLNSLHLLALKAASVGIIVVSSILLYRGSMSISNMLMMCIFAFVIFGHVEQMNEAVHVLEIIDVTVDKLENIKKAEFIDGEGKDIKLECYNITFKDVSFAYEQKIILNNISFKIPDNKTTAIVGPSGSGKSTICSLIARFYDVDKGSISVGNVNVKEMTCDSLLKNISMVFQKVYLFHDTVINNIRFGKPDADYKEVVEAAKKACCHDFIMGLPNGYDTIVGEGGATLSGGEKQRISIARAILKDAPIIILDEATASVDPENEHLIQLAITALTKGKTIIIIAHRLATIQNAHQILVLDEGHIVQKGTHDELKKQGGVYGRFISIRERAEGWII